MAATQFLERRAAGDRLHRNMVVFLAPDKARLGELRQGVRDFLAWRSIDADLVLVDQLGFVPAASTRAGAGMWVGIEPPRVTGRVEPVETLNLDNFQRRQAEQASPVRRRCRPAHRETFAWVVVPSQSATDPAVTWDETRLNGPDPLAVRISRKLKGEEELITEYSGVRLRMDLDRVPLWRRSDVGLKQLWSDYSQYLYLPRLRDARVELDAVRQGVALLTWDPDTLAYASAVEEPSGRYTGLVAGEHPAVVLDATSVVVKPEVAARQLGEDRAVAAASRADPAARDPGDGRRTD